MMRTAIDDKLHAIAALCRKFNVEQLELFGSALRPEEFDPANSDADFLVRFAPATKYDLAAYADLKDALERLLGRPVDLVDRAAVEQNRNYIRRERILSEALSVYG